MTSFTSLPSRTPLSAEVRVGPSGGIARNSVAEALSRVGAVASDFQWPSLTVGPGEDRVISRAGDGLPRRTLATEDLDELKAWIGVDDLWIRAGLHQPTPQRPSSFRPPRALVLARHLDAGQERELSLARAAYLFGDSALVAHWRPLIQRHHPRHFIDVVTADTITIARHGRLILAGRPVLFAARRLEIRGGSFVSTVDGSYAFGVLHVVRVPDGRPS